MKMSGASSRSSCPFSCLMADHTTAQISDGVSEEIIICSGKLQRYNSIYTRNKKENKNKKFRIPYDTNI